MNTKIPTAKKIREELGLSQRKLAKKLKISQTYVYLWENNIRAIPVKLAMKLIKLSSERYILDDFYECT
jgi:transcriptional regulator with XRE-family HTH domain